jgi:nitrile hydratase accessory protein
MPHTSGEPVFGAPWEAHAFALTLMLHERGVFAWPEWTAILATEIERAQAAGDPDTGETYYRHWLAALEHLVAERGLTDQPTLKRYRDAWAHAAHRTPHGSPIELTPDDIR